MGEGDVFGEKNLIETDPFAFTALTRNECTLLLLRKEELLNLMSRHMEILECWVDVLNETQGKEEPEIVEALFG